MKEQCGHFILNPRHKCKICVTNNLFLGINKIPWPAYFIRGFSIKSVDVNTKSTLDKVILNTVLPVYQDIHAMNVKLVFVLLFCNIMTVSGEKYNTTLFIFGTEASRIVTSLVPDRRDQDYSVSSCRKDKHILLLGLITRNRRDHKDTLSGGSRIWWKGGPELL